MTIDRKKVKNVFKKYTDNYDTSDEKIKLKVDHTYRVAALSERIARSLGLGDDDTNLAWLIGMLHDIGRFEQLKNYGTFSDAESIDHAHYGVELLFEGGFIEKFVGENAAKDLKGTKDLKEIAVKSENEEKETKEISELDILRTAIWNHSAYRVEEGLTDRVKMFCNIIRDADKIDILKVNYDVTLEVIYDVTTEELKNSGVTDEVMKAFMEHHAVLRSLKKTPIDNLVGHAALVFELVYNESFKIVKEQGYIEKMLSYVSDNQDTVKKFEIMRNDMNKFLAEHE
ncbi:HD domain-containing protein [Butyribacter sp.]|uniref:HD domain-containing protein n=1 Tax=Butyribacter sp. TaxID=2822465 RepID=UPI002A937A1B|nr:HD domain-containing protein [Butyribacter sp.]